MAGALESIGSVAFNILYNSLGFLILGGLIVGVFFAVKLWGKKRKVKKSYVLNALIIKPDGDWEIDLLGYHEHQDKLDKLKFKRLEHTMPVIPNNLIRGRKVILFNYGPKQYAVIPPSIWGIIDLKKFNIELINMQMKNFAFLEQRAAVSRWAYVKDLMTKLAPWITIALIVAASGIAIWFMMKMALNLYQQVTAARLQDCVQLLPQLNVPKPSG